MASVVMDPMLANVRRVGHISRNGTETSATTISAKAGRPLDAVGPTEIAATVKVGPEASAQRERRAKGGLLHAVGPPVDVRARGWPYRQYLSVRISASKAGAMFRPVSTSTTG